MTISFHINVKYVIRTGQFYFSRIVELTNSLKILNKTIYYRFRHALMTWGDKFTAKEVDDAFDVMEIDDNNRIDTAALIGLLTGPQKEDEGEGEAA